MKKIIIMVLGLTAILFSSICSAYAETKTDVYQEFLNDRNMQEFNEEIDRAGRERALVARLQRIPYSTPWGAMYRDPEAENSYGRAWYETAAYKTCPNICFESYYDYGVYASVIYKYNKNGKSKGTVKRDGSGTSSVCVKYTKDVKGSFHSVDYYGSGYNFTAKKHYGGN